MNKQKSQQGSAHLIIIIILAVALIGTLGFVFWQNFMQPKVSDTALTTDSNNYLTVSEWGVKGVWNSSSTISYEIFQPSGIAGFDSSALDCGVTHVSRIERYLGTDTVYPDGIGGDNLGVASVYYANDNLTGQESLNKKVGNYYYALHGPLQDCARPDQTSILYQLYSDMKLYFASLMEI